MMNASDALYREVIMDHQRSPRGDRPLDAPDAEASGRNPSCGDEVTLQLRYDGDRIAEVGVISRGCAISTASGSILAEMLTGRTLDEAREIVDVFRDAMQGDDFPDDVDLGDLEALEGVRKFPLRIKCALLPWVTLLDAMLAGDDDRRPRISTTEDQ